MLGDKCWFRRLFDEGINEVGGGTREVAVGLGDDNVIARRAKVDKLAVFGGAVLGEAVLVEASVGLVGDVEVEVALVQNPH